MDSVLGLLLEHGTDCMSHMLSEGTWTSKDLISLMLTCKELNSIALGNVRRIKRCYSEGLVNISSFEKFKRAKYIETRLIHDRVIYMDDEKQCPHKLVNVNMRINAIDAINVIKNIDVHGSGIVSIDMLNANIQLSQRFLCITLPGDQPTLNAVKHIMEPWDVSKVETLVLVANIANIGHVLSSPLSNVKSIGARGSLRNVPIFNDQHMFPKLDELIIHKCTVLPKIGDVFPRIKEVHFTCVNKLFTYLLQNGNYFPNLELLIVDVYSDDSMDLIVGALNILSESVNIKVRVSFEAVWQDIEDPVRMGSYILLMLKHVAIESHFEFIYWMSEAGGPGEIVGSCQPEDDDVERMVYFCINMVSALKKLYMRTCELTGNSNIISDSTDIYIRQAYEHILSLEDKRITVIDLLPLVIQDV